MSASFVLVWRVVPPSDVTLMVRSGASVFDAYHSKWRNEWFALVPGGLEERVPEPQFWWCEDEYAKTHQRDIAPPIAKHSPRLRRSKKPQQMALNL
jgi:hypothetical protein